jgi:hypothetical protein
MGTRWFQHASSSVDWRHAWEPGLQLRHCEVAAGEQKTGLAAEYGVSQADAVLS